ncbi:MAG: ImmA/IrrE family metallo-endopeptidase [Nitrosomonas sp.]|uniref:ImmA/IrrE family metallo-endopeptidase n=1 Tax=Nitrosomonas sp. TaxID=42353 RepID=UPI001DCECE9C|nr:ImmA/IrrE family metallo-endopeptidase [Nitrosomonas sp.]MBX9895688.1 ImmA/IrrE family metallo-endopeptidase [Nitrosomonas sp.]
MIEEQKGAAEAETLLEELGFEELPIVPIDVANAINCDDFRLVMEYQDFQSDKILGKAEGNSRGALIYINKNIPDAGRLNFTASHEIGHVCMHVIPQKRLSFECGTKELSDSFNDPVEKQANGFASGLLMPKRLITLHSDCDVNWRNISTISKLCGASLEATYRRLSFLQKSPSALVIHKDGNFKRFVASRNFEFFIDRTPLSEEQISLIVDVKDDRYPMDFDTVDASDWVNTSSKSDKLDTIYSSTILLNDGYTYTILSYDDDCIAEESENY